MGDVKRPRDTTSPTTYGRDKDFHSPILAVTRSLVIFLPALVPLVSRRSLRVFPPLIHYASAATRGTSRTKRGEDRGAAAVV